MIRDKDTVSESFHLWIILIPSLAIEELPTSPEKVKHGEHGEHVKIFYYFIEKYFLASLNNRNTSFKSFKRQYI